MSKVIKGVALGALIYFTGGIAAGFAMGLGASSTVLAGMLAVTDALAIGAALGGISAMLTPTQPRPSATVEYSGTVEPRRIIYGQVKVGGMNVLPPVTSGTNNALLHQAMAVAGHEVNAITDVYFGQDLISSASIGAVSGGSSDGLVSSGTYSGKAWIRRYTGTSTQAADYILDNALTIWTSSHQGRGVAYLAIQYQYDETVYKSGKPDVTCIVQGMKVYDPRQDSTNGGSGSQRVATPSTWTYSANPALCLANYLIDSAVGMGEDQARIDWAMVATAADHCDESVVCPTSSTQNRYTCNAVLYATDAYESNIQLLAGTMLGSCLYSGGKWRIRAGVWESATFSLSDSNVMPGGVSIVTAYPYKERYNGVRGTFVDPNNNYQPTEFPATSDATYVSADGESTFKEIQLPGCTNVYEAQRTAILLTRKSRNRQAATVACDMSAWKVRPGDTGIVTITELGWTNKTVRCEGWKFNPEGWVELSIREELSSDWNDPIEADYTSPLAISNPTPVYYTPDAPSALTATGGKNGFTLNWTAPALVPTGALYQVWEYTSSTPFASASLVWTGTATSVFLPKSDTTTRYYWVRLVMPNGTLGTEYPTASAGVSGAATLVQTTDLATGAVTNVYTTSGTSISITGSLASPTDVGSVTVPAQTVACTVVITVTSNMYIVTNGSGAGGVWAYAGTTVNGTYDATTGNARVYSAAASNTVVNASTFEETFSLAASTSATYHAYAFRSGAGASSAGANSFTIKAEVILR